jgi:hypothetical protein
MNEGNEEKNLLDLLSGEPEEARPLAVDALPRDLREQLANEIKSLPEMQDAARNPARNLSPRDAERIVSLFHQTLQQVGDRGGFLHDVPRREARIRRMRERIQATKEELSGLCEQMVAKQRTLRWLGAQGSSRRGPRPRHDPGQPQVEHVQMELKNLRAQTRRVSENLLVMIHELAEEVQRCERIKIAAAGRGEDDYPPSRSLDHRRMNASPMVFRPNRSRSV